MKSGEKDCACLNLAGTSDKSIIWKKAIIKNLKVDVSKIKDWSKVRVAMHHWTKSQLEHLLGGPKRRCFSSPIPHSEASKMMHSVDKECFIKQKGQKLYFNLPNYPISLIREDTSSLCREKVLSARRNNIISEI